MINKSSFIQSLKYCPKIIAGESTRLGGIGKFPYESLNLGIYTDDDPNTVMENRRIFFTGLGKKEEETAGSHQIHGDALLMVKKPGQYEGYDALMTDKKGILLSITIADCTPVLIYDSANDAIAAVHAGWKGTVKKLVRKTLGQMAEHFGTRGEDCHAYIGTCIDECSFEVDVDVADAFDASFKRWDEKRSKFFINLKQANREQLLDFGLPAAQVEVSPFSTCLDNERFFSYRKENGKTGRMLAVIGLI